MREHKKPQNRLPVVLGVTIACATAGVFGVGAAMAQSSPSEDDYSLAALTRPAEPKDSLPAEVVNSTQPIQHGSSRFLAEEDGVHYWTGLDEKGNVCLIAYFGTDEWVSGQSCTTQEVFLKSGSGLRLYGPEGLVEAYLVPDDVRVDGPTTRITDNVYTVDPHLNSSKRSSHLKTDISSDEFQLALFGDAFSLEGPQ